VKNIGHKQQNQS